MIENNIILPTQITTANPNINISTITQADREDRKLELEDGELELEEGELKDNPMVDTDRDNLIKHIVIYI